MSFLADELAGLFKVDPSAAVLEHDGHWYSWGAIGAAAAHIDALLADAGIGRDGRVGVLLRNRPGQLSAMLAVLASGRCLVTLNPLLPAEKLAADIHGLALPIVIGEAADIAANLDVLTRAGSAILTLAPDLGGIALLEGHERPTGEGLRPIGEGVAIEMLTSGTTGTPKRIPLARSSFDKSFSGAIFYEGDRKPGEPPRLRDGIVLQSEPLTHIGGIYVMLTSLLGGRKICLLERFTVAGWHDAIVRHRPRVTGAVPAALRMILDADLPREDLASLVALRTGTAPLDPAIADAFLEKYDLPVLQTYGATEFAGAVAGWTLKDFRLSWKDKHGSAGRLHRDVEARVRDIETDEELPRGCEGILELRAAQLGDPDRWHRTTDRVTIDADGFLFVHGRADNAINRGGFKIHPDDVNRALESHPAIREAVTVGLKDRRLGEVPGAALVIRGGFATPSSDELREYLQSRLLPYQVPTRFLAIAEFPRTPSMKPAVPLVRAMFEEDD